MVNSHRLAIIKNFHEYIFTEVLNIKGNLQFDFDNSAFHLLMIALRIKKNSIVIDFDVMEKAVQGFPPKLTEEEKRCFVYNPENYKNAVVKPWYNNDESANYYVETINQSKDSKEINNVGGHFLLASQ